MTRRLWVWTGALAAAGGALLAATIHAYDSWRPPPDSVEVLTLHQLLGFVGSVLLLVAAALTLFTGLRRSRRRRMVRRRAEAVGLHPTTIDDAPRSSRAS